MKPPHSSFDSTPFPRPYLIREGGLFAWDLLAGIGDLLASPTDVSDGSDQLVTHSTSWPALYHLSPERPNVLRVFSTLIGGTVLEIGAECGAVTRFLGENSQTVVSIETDPLCASIARKRCRGLRNVSICE